MTKTEAQEHKNNTHDTTATLVALQKKWQDKWQEAQVFEADAVDDNSDDKKNKYFLTFPFPYVNGLPHLGHLYTNMRVEARARFKRLQGKNVLFPQAWHCTGVPIMAAAKRVAQGDEKQKQILRDFFIPEEKLDKFADAEYWLEYFPPEYKKDTQAMGLSIDWRREFITTDKDARFDAFIQWQMYKLQEAGYVKQGKFPVVWDPVEEAVVPDHDRKDGEGEVPQEYMLIKFDQEHPQHGKIKIVCATLRPETVFGVTNIWVAPKVQYVYAKVSNSERNEVWLVAKAMLNKLTRQDYAVDVLEEVEGESLLGQMARLATVKNPVPLLPASFCSDTKGSGLVMSVPSDSPDDYMGLQDLDEKALEKYGLDTTIVSEISIIPIIHAEELGDMAAKVVCEELKIQNSKQRDLLEKAKAIVYKKGFYEGVLNENCGQFANLPVEKAKEKIKAQLIEDNIASVFYELSGKVVSRFLNECVIKIVDNQWFIDYGDESWKAATHECLDNMRFFPEQLREQMRYVIDWLHKWACTRKQGQGSRLPWDKDWLIESLSDSTIYMAYYTIAHLVQKIPANKLTPAFFDYIFLDKGSGSSDNSDDEQISALGIDATLIQKMKTEFHYWYPLDLRSSGKDLIQNHFAFFLFAHTAVFPKKHWPQELSANGHVTVDGKKMSKSLGNLIPLRTVATEFGADVARLTILYGGEGLDDANWDSALAKSLGSKFEQMMQLAKDISAQTFARDGQLQTIDKWALSRLHSLIKKSQEAYESMMYRTAITACFFDIQNVIKWYFRRTKNDAHKDVITALASSQAQMLSPICPHVCEEVWEILGHSSGDFVSTSSWPAFDDKYILANEAEEDVIRTTLADLNQVKHVTKMNTIATIDFFVAAPWKYELFSSLQLLMQETRHPGELLRAVMKDERFKQHGKMLQKLVPRLAKVGIDDMLNYDEELAAMKAAAAFFEQEFNCTVTVTSEAQTEEKKAQQALPGKPAILLS